MNCPKCGSKMRQTGCARIGNEISKDYLCKNKECLTQAELVGFVKVGSFTRTGQMSWYKQLLKKDLSKAYEYAKRKELDING